MTGLQVCRAKMKDSFLFSKTETKQKGVVKIVHKGRRDALFDIMPEWEEGREGGTIALVASLFQRTKPSFSN